MRAWTDHGPAVVAGTGPMGSGWVSDRAGPRRGHAATATRGAAPGLWTASVPHGGTRQSRSGTQGTVVHLPTAFPPQGHRGRTSAQPTSTWQAEASPGHIRARPPILGPSLTGSTGGGVRRRAGRSLTLAVLAVVAVAGCGGGAAPDGSRHHGRLHVVGSGRSARMSWPCATGSSGWPTGVTRLEGIRLRRGASEHPRQRARPRARGPATGARLCAGADAPPGADARLRGHQPDHRGRGLPDDRPHRGRGVHHPATHRRAAQAVEHFRIMGRLPGRDD